MKLGLIPCHGSKPLSVVLQRRISTGRSSSPSATWSRPKRRSTPFEQGEGPLGDWRDAHFGQFVIILDEYLDMRSQDPGASGSRGSQSGQHALTDEVALELRKAPKMWKMSLPPGALQSGVTSRRLARFICSMACARCPSDPRPPPPPPCGRSWPELTTRGAGDARGVGSARRRVVEGSGMRHSAA